MQLLVPDGVFVDAENRLAFALHPVPISADVVAILDRIVRRIARRLADEAREEAGDEGVDVLAQVQAEAAATWRSPSDGKPTVRGVERLRAWFEGYSLHAGVVIAEHDRAALERLCRYGARPAFAHERLAWTAEGQIAYRLKRPWPDGRTHLVLPPVAFLRRLCGTIPPPRRHLVRYAGVFGPAHRQRAKLCGDHRRRGTLRAHAGALRARRTIRGSHRATRKFRRPRTPNPSPSWPGAPAIECRHRRAAPSESVGHIWRLPRVCALPATWVPFVFPIAHMSLPP
jgi:hypothetical protein